MTTIYRRTLIGGLAAIPTTACPRCALRAAAAQDDVTRPQRASATPTELERYHLEAYKAAVQAADPTIKSWWKVVPEDEGDIAFWLIAQRLPA